MLQFASLATLLVAASAYNTGFSSFGGLRSVGGVRSVSGLRAYGGLRSIGAVRNIGYAVPAGLVGVNTGYLNTGLVGVANAGYSVGTGYTLGSAAVAPLAVQSVHQVQYADVPSGGQINPISVEIDAAPIPINMLFRSASSQLAVQQAHQGAAGSVQESSSEDEAHVLRHSVTKPVLQEIREVITPFRKITQEIQPVQEQINTIVARGVAQRAVAVAAPVQAVQTVQAVAAPIQTVQAVRAIATPVIQRGVVGVTRIAAAPVATQVVSAVPATSAVETVDVEAADDVQGGAVVAADNY